MRNGFQIILPATPLHDTIRRRKDRTAVRPLAVDIITKTQIKRCRRAHFPRQIPPHWRHSPVNPHAAARYPEYSDTGLPENSRTRLSGISNGSACSSGRQDKTWICHSPAVNDRHHPIGDRPQAIPALYRHRPCFEHHACASSASSRSGVKVRDFNAAMMAAVAVKPNNCLAVNGRHG